MNTDFADKIGKKDPSPMQPEPTAYAEECAGPASRPVEVPSTEILRRDPLWERFARRALDIVVASVSLVIIGIPLLYFMLRIRRETPGPAIHHRKVMKKGGGTFFAYKLRTMVQNADEILQRDKSMRDNFEKNYKLVEDPRITPTGRFLRTSSIDEFPQLVNVLRGEMSIVGPRMICPDELPKYGPYGEKLLSVRPGLTGYWQISGRQHVDYEERVLLDMEYIDRRSLWFDLYILFKTPLVVLKRTGAF